MITQRLRNRASLGYDRPPLAVGDPQLHTSVSIDSISMERTNTEYL
jgi:hypothetical protein